MLWTEIPVHVIDFEGSRATGVVEFGVVTVQGGAIRAVATRVCRARTRVPADERRVHGLGERELSGAQPFEDEWERFAALRASGLLAAHFSGTEHGLLRAVWPCPRLSPDFLHAGGETAEWGPWIDTGRLAAGALPPGNSAALEDVVRALGLEAALAEASERWCPLERRRFHCAPYDALAAALALLHLAGGAEDGPWTLVRLVAASTADRERRDAFTQGRLF